LFEELLVNGQGQNTEHPRIQRAQEAYMLWSELAIELAQLKEYCQQKDVHNIRKQLMRLPLGFVSAA
jgi:FlaA1/EpsC-like NDP-sugar epimerase